MGGSDWGAKFNKGEHMSDRDLEFKRRADQELRYKAIVLKDPEAIQILHYQVLGCLFCCSALQDQILEHVSQTEEL